ncbi:protein winged eye isoform X2 [Tribolium madens]|uniref:protein winged eye isoform X2 n=1 Tax=Tribolium madens TaxID=41895 RepID=UPI001CF72588|nr:protein winged eye isoform X2 [Tribolium madens]
MLGSPAGPGGPNQRGLWPLAPAPAPASNFTADSFNKCGVYSLFPGGPSFGSALYSHARTIGQFTSGHIQQSSGNSFYHKDSLFSTAGYTFGAPTPPPGSPYSPVPVTQLELLTKGFNSNIIIQQPDYPISPKKLQDKRCDEKCCSLKLQKPCDCRSGSPLKKFPESANGCSRTNPIDWSGVNVKKEPGSTPCQVAEITTSVSPVVKLEVTSPKNTNERHQNIVSNSSINGTDFANGNIPVGIAVARQRFQQQEVIGSPSLPPAGLLTTVNAAQIKDVARVSEVGEGGTAGMAASTTGGATLLQCSDDRSTALAGWSMGGTHGSTLATPTLWQYPEPLQQAVVWPSYHQTPSVLLPPLPPPPLQLLSSASSDYLSSSTTLHQHTQTHSTRLVAVTTDSKRKIPLPIPATTLIKIETDATLDQTKTLQAVSTIGNSTGTVFTDQNMAPLVTTHVIYQHPNLILSQPTTSETLCRSQATSPVTCLTPPPENVSIPEEEPLAVQDASNQTDTPICSEDDNTTLTVAEHHEIIENKEPQGSASISPVPEQIQDTKLKEPEQVQKKSTQKEENGSQVQNEHKSKPDISGLELLSNSIVEFENGRGSVKLEQMEHKETGETLKNYEKESERSQTINDTLGGLKLLCALAEQRIMEENVEKHRIEKEKSKEHKSEKRKLKKEHSDEHESKRKKNKRDKNGFKHESCRISVTNSVEDCICPIENYRSYKTPESEEEVKKFIASKSQASCCDGDWPQMNEMELDMRMKLADLQRQYREKQKELSRLKPRKYHSQECKKRCRKKSTHSDCSITPPPQLDKIDMSLTTYKNQELLKPPTLCAFDNTKTPKLEAIKQSDRIINDYKNDLLRQQALEELESSPEKNSSSKKRKVGRPKKLLSPLGCHVATETIVAKKPKNNFVGYFLAAKEKFQLQSKMYANSPPRYLEEPTITNKTKKNKNNNNIIIADIKSCKIRPKLKAELTIRAYNDEEEHEWETELEENDEVETEENDVLGKLLVEEVVEEIQEVHENIAQEMEDVKDVEEPKPVDNRCILNAEHLEIDKLRVLTAMGGLFYAGHLNAVEPPDVYSITLDGERGNRPHIMSREEILRDAFVEVAPKSTQELVAGTRLCAYWSQQYRCLYPGSVAEPGTPDPALDSKFVAVEFDDGDSGRIALEDIRLLPPDYPIIEYDPNPLLSLSKRRRRTSTSVSTEERRQVPVQQPPPPITTVEPLKPIPEIEKDTEKENKDINKPDTESHKERKRLKKKKREKLKQRLLHEDKKKKKKHKCTDEFCKHKKHHKKHRKHKKHHHYDEKKDVQVVQSIEVPDCDSESVERVEEDDSSVFNPEDEVTIDDIIEAKAKSKKTKKIRDRQESCESRSKMSAFLPARQLWGWSGKGYKRPRAKGRSRKQFYKAIQRGKETITVGDSAVFLSTGRPDRPYIGKIEAMWELCGTMVVKVKWFYHPEETIGCPLNLQYPGALFESPHIDENDVQTISHKCEVLPLEEYTERLGDDPQRYAMIYDNNDIYYLAGYYDPTTTTLKMEPNIPFSKPD